MFGFLKSGYQKVKEALSKTRQLLGGRLRALLGGGIDETTFDQLEQILYEADLGSRCAAEFAEEVRHLLRKNPAITTPAILEAMQAKALAILTKPATTHPHQAQAGEPLVILVVGVNGSGKTTSLAKLARLFQEEGKKVLIGAGDTFRAAAIDQLALWANKLKLEIVKSTPGSDPSAVAFDALTAAKSRGCEVVLIDTAGRLQNKTDLMHELAKIQRVCQKVIPGSPHETLIVLDATTGQNAIDQIQVFHQFTPLSGIILSKLDGSAKGGIILSIYSQFHIPVRWIGVGEGAEDLIPFEPEAYVKSLFE